MNKRILKTLLVSISLSMLLPWDTIKSMEDLNNNEASPQNNESIQERVTSLTNICVQHIIRHFEDYAPEIGPSMVSALSHDIQKKLFFERLAYLEREMDAEELKEQLEGCTDGGMKIKNLQNSYQMLFMRSLSWLLSCTEINQQEAHLLIKSLIKSIIGKQDLNFNKALAHCSASNAAQLKAASLKYSADYNYLSMFNMIVSRGYDRQRMSYTKLKSQDIDPTSFDISVGQHYYVPQSACSSPYNVQLQQLITQMTTQSGKLPNIPVAQIALHEKGVLQILPIKNSQYMYLYLFLEDQIIGVLADYDVFPCKMKGNVTRILLDKYGKRLLLQINDQTWFIRQLPGYLSALVHNELTLQELLYVLAVGHPVCETEGDDAMVTILYSETKKKLYNHPELKSIKEKNAELYKDLIVTMDAIWRNC